MKLTKQARVVIELDDEEVKRLRNFLKNVIGIRTSRYDEPLIREMHDRLDDEET